MNRREQSIYFAEVDRIRQAIRSAVLDAQADHPEDLAVERLAGVPLRLVKYDPLPEWVVECGTVEIAAGTLSTLATFGCVLELTDDEIAPGYHLTYSADCQVETVNATAIGWKRFDCDFIVCVTINLAMAVERV